MKKKNEEFKLQNKNKNKKAIHQKGNSFLLKSPLLLLFLDK